MNKPVSTSMLPLSSMFTSADDKVDDDDATTIAPIPCNFYLQLTKALNQQTFSFHYSSNIYH